MTLLFRRFLDDTSAAAAIEYALIAAMIACVLIGTLQNLGGKLNAKLGKVNAALS